MEPRSRSQRRPIKKDFMPFGAQCELDVSRDALVGSGVRDEDAHFLRRTIRGRMPPRQSADVAPYAAGG
jgi:hypothetical protein